MFRCHVIKELSAYLDNQLSDKQKLKIDKHLQKCVLCSNELSRLKVLSGKMIAWQPLVLDADFDDSVRNEIVRRELEKGAVKMKKNTLFIIVPSGVLAALLMFVFVGRFTLQRGLQGEVSEVRSELDSINAGGKRSEALSYRMKENFSDEKKSMQLAYNEENMLKNKEYAPQVSAGSMSDSAVRGKSKAQAVWLPPTETPLDNGSVIVIQPVLPATGEGDKIIRTGTIKLEVDNGKDTYKSASLICQELGGYMSSSNFYKDGENRESGTITMRIPKEKFTVALDRLSALGKVENIDTGSQDVSQEYANLKSEMDAAMVIYNKMLEALQKKQVTISDAIRIESELTPVLKRVQNYKNKIEALNNAVSYTTVTVTFHESKVSAKALEESKKLIREGMLTAKIKLVKNLAAAIPNIVGFVFLFAIIAAIAFLIKYLVVSLFKRG